jgi:large subunit ribosomal protein L22
MRIVANLVRGKAVPEALNQLHFLSNKAAKPIETTIKSAVSNLFDKADKGQRVDDDALVVREIFVDQGTVFKRFQPVSRGRAHRIRKPTAHLTVVVGLREAEEEAAA